jgi:hypothetical protein
MRPYLEKTLHKKGLVEWFKVNALSSNPSTTKKKKERRIEAKINGTEALKYSQLIFDKGAKTIEWRKDRLFSIWC